MKGTEYDAGGKLYDDLDAPSGVGRLCPGLRYPAEPRVGPGRGYGSQYATDLALYGSLAVAGFNSGTYYDSKPAYRLYSCRSRLNLPINTLSSPAADTQAVIWQPSESGPLRGVLPSLRQISIRAPRFAGLPDVLGGRTVYLLAALGGRTIYFLAEPTSYTSAAQLWSAALPLGIH